MNFGDRYYRMPPYFIANLYSKKDIELGKNINLEKPKVFTKDDLAKKTDFCSFVYSNYLADDRRKILLDKLNAYKKVNSGGKYLNNIGGPVENKLEFELKHKFSMAIENSCRGGYTTDRILNSLMASTVPIYWGNPEIGREFNTSRFINCHEYDSFDQVVERVKEIDKNDDLYLKIVNEPVFAKDYSFKKMLDGFDNFIKNIIDQSLDVAPRRTINQARGAEFEKNERLLGILGQIRSKTRGILAIIYQPFKRSEVIENLKQKYFKNKITR
jgi:hypothetical protein